MWPWLCESAAITPLQEIVTEYFLCKKTKTPETNWNCQLINCEVVYSLINAIFISQH